MANIIIGYHNQLLLNDTVTVTTSSEHADHDADNLMIASPTEFHRFSSLSSMWTQVDFSGLTTTEPFYDLICPLYVTATTERNMLPNSLLPSSPEWSLTNVTRVPFEGTSVPKSYPQANPIAFTESGSGNHYMSFSNGFYGLWSMPRTLKLWFRVYVYQSENDRNSRIRVQGDSGEYITFDLTSNGQAPAYYADASAGGATLDNYTVAATGVDSWVKVELEVTLPASTSRYEVWLQSLNASYSASYASESNHRTRWLNPQLYVGGDSIPTIDFTSNLNAYEAPFWICEFSDSSPASSSPEYESDPQHLVTSPEFSRARGWSHGAPILVDPSHVSGSPLTNRNYCGFYFQDDDNPDSRLDVSNIYVGPYWQPTVNVADDWTIKPAQAVSGVGRAYGGQEYRAVHDTPRELTLRLAYETPEDALHDAHTMGIRAGQHSPILVWIDPDETTHIQEQLIYGVLTNLTIGAQGWFADRGDGTAGTRYQINMTVRELLP